MDNIDFAVLSKIQDLGNRFGIKAYEFIATLDHSTAVTGMGVKFEIATETSEPQAARARGMLDAIGVDKNGVLKGGEIAVIDALDAALLKAPKPRANTPTGRSMSLREVIEVDEQSPSTRGSGSR